MPHPAKRLFSTMLFMAAMVPSLAHAQSTPGTVDKIARFGGAMHAAAHACPDYKGGDLGRLKNEQKQQSMTAGLSAAEFETLFQAGYAEARTRLAKATPAEKTKACKQLAAIGGFRR